MVSEDGSWTLIDFGKAGIADYFRDLSSIKNSLERNLDMLAYLELLSYLKFQDYTEEINNKTSAYHLLDLFWHNAQL